MFTSTILLRPVVLCVPSFVLCWVWCLADCIERVDWEEFVPKEHSCDWYTLRMSCFFRRLCCWHVAVIFYSQKGCQIKGFVHNISVLKKWTKKNKKMTEFAMLLWLSLLPASQSTSGSSLSLEAHTWNFLLVTCVHAYSVENMLLAVFQGEN